MFRMSLLNEFNAMDHQLDELMNQLARQSEQLQGLERGLRAMHELDYEPLYRHWDEEDEQFWLRRESTVPDPLLDVDEDMDRRFGYYEYPITDDESEFEQEDLTDDSDDCSFTTVELNYRHPVFVNNPYGLNDDDTDLEDWCDPYSTPI